MSRERQAFQGTPHKWQMTADYKIVATDPFNGDLSSLRKIPEGVLICQLEVDRTDAVQAQAEALANAGLIIGAHELLAVAIEVRQSLTHADFYGPRRGRLIELLDAAIADATTPAMPVYVTVGVANGGS